MASRRQRPLLAGLICFCVGVFCCQHGQAALSDLASLVEKAPRLRKSGNRKWKDAAEDIRAEMYLEDPSIVKTKLGDIQGELLPTGRRFRTIPYTQPPTGNLRFEPPRMVEPWKPRVINATFGEKNKRQLKTKVQVMECMTVYYLGMRRSAWVPSEM